MGRDVGSGGKGEETLDMEMIVGKVGMRMIMGDIGARPKGPG